MRTKKRLSKKEIAALTKEYERRIKKDDREEVLYSLSKKYRRSTRQIERYIEKAKKERETKEKLSEPQVVTIRSEDTYLKAAHYEDIRQAIKLWIENQRRASPEELSGLWKGKLSAWGVEVESLPGTERRALLTMSSHALYESLGAHLMPPVVKEDFWGTVSKISTIALMLVDNSVKCFAQIAADATNQTGLPINADEWKNAPATGLTSAFTKTVFDQSMQIHSFTNWTYHAWAVLWPASGGLIITWVNEGTRLLRRMGYDPGVSLTTCYLTMVQPLLLPRSSTERVVYGNVDLHSPGSVGFLLCFGNEEIALLAAPEQIAGCQQVHGTMMQKYSSWDKAARLRQAWAKLDTLSNKLSAELQRAQYSLSFPGHCPLCP